MVVAEVPIEYSDGVLVIVSLSNSGARLSTNGSGEFDWLIDSIYFVVPDAVHTAPMHHGEQSTSSILLQ